MIGREHDDGVVKLARLLQVVQNLSDGLSMFSIWPAYCLRCSICSWCVSCVQLSASGYFRFFTLSNIFFVLMKGGWGPRKPTCMKNGLSSGTFSSKSVAIF